MTIGKWLKWTVAVAASLGVHLAAARLLEPPPPLTQIAGGIPLDVSVLGNAFEETLQAGTPTDAIDPSTDPVPETEPLEAETVETTEAIPPVDSVETPTDSLMPIPSEPVAETAMAEEAVPPLKADVLVPADDVPPLAADNPDVIAAVPPAQTVIPVEKPAEIKPVAPEKAIRAETEKVEKPVRKVVEPKPVRRKVVRKKAGEGGAAEMSQKKGAVDGASKGSASEKGGKGAVGRAAGNAAVSNYRGKIQARVNRAFRYPSAARRQGINGSGTVRFTVLSSGAVTGVSVVRSAGSPLLDQAAVDGVRRAAPFPKIPAEAGRARWDFTVPFTFSM